MDYRSFACSQKGAEHEKSNTPCQDSALNCIDKDLAVAIAVVADGHGSPECFRSDRGSRFAVECAVECIKRFVYAVGENNLLAELTEEKKAAELMSQLANSIVASWNGRIEKDYANSPFDVTDPACIEQAYGSTLIAAAATEKYWLGLQIGDGKCAVMSSDGSFYQPIPADDRCFMNVTTSMCDGDAAREFRYYLGIDKPAAIFIGTDGVDNSFESDAQLYDLYSCIAGDFISKGIDAGIEEVKNFLPALTKKGSGDDVSIAGIIKVF